MSTRSAARTLGAALTLLAAVGCVLSGCAKQDYASESAASAHRPAEPHARGAPDVRSDGLVPPGPVDGDGQGKVAVSPIEIPALSQSGLEIGYVIDYVEQHVRRQCPDGGLCGITVVEGPREPDETPSADAERSGCAYAAPESQKVESTVIPPATIVLPCNLSYTEPESTAPVSSTAPEPDEIEPDGTVTSTPDSTS
jgi:hypothetical protein